MAHIFILDRPVLEHFLGWNGPMGRDMRRRGRTLEFRARSSAPFRTGKLKLGIRTRERTVVNGLQIEVGNFSGPNYAAAQHQGARPHVITPRNATALHFYWAKKQTWVTTKYVFHPGNPATHYLSRWLREAVR
jgi:hypothetical protein